MKTFTQKELEEMRITKGDLAIKLELSSKYDAFDCALPQVILNQFVLTYGLNYELVRSTTFCVYPKGETFGILKSCCDVVQAALDKYEAKGREALE